MKINTLLNGGYSPGGFTTEGGVVTGQIILAAPPKLDFHLTNKRYVDQQVDTRLPTTGGSLTGILTLAQDPINPLDAVTKQYTDSNLSTHSNDTSVHLKANERSLLNSLYVTATDLNNLDGITSNVQTQLNSKLNLAGGTLTGALTLATDPTTNLQASTKQYVDNTVSSHASDSAIHITPTQNTWIDSITATAAEVNYLSGVTSNVQSQLNSKLALAGGTMTGDLTLRANPTTGLHAATKQYVDSADATKLNKAGDTMTGTLTLAADPTAALQASTKQYVDNSLSSHATDMALHLTSTQNAWLDAVTATAAEVNYLSGTTSSVQSQLNSKLALSGGNLTGALTLAANPTAALHAATKQYVDAVGNGKLALTGGTMTGALTLSGAPTSNLHAATKQYVDGGISAHAGDVSLHLTSTQNTWLDAITATSTEVNYLSGVTSAIQTQLNTVSTSATGKVSKAGDTMTGALTLSGDPTATLHAATKQYVDTGLSGKVDLTSSQTVNGTKTFSDLVISGPLKKTGGTAPAYCMTQDGTGRQHWYWNTVGGTTPTYSVASEGATSISMHADDTGVEYFKFRAASGVGKNAGDPITWEDVLYATRSGTFQFKGSDVITNGNAATTLPDTGVTAGTYQKVTVDAKGRVTAGAALAATDIPNLDTSKLTTGTLAAARLPAFTGDVTSTAGTSSLTLANTGVTAGTYQKVTVDAKGRVTAGAALAATDIPNLDWSKIVSGKPTTLSGYGITDAINNITTGSVLRIASSTAPTGFLACNGQNVSPTTYATLYGVLGYRYGKYNASSDNYINSTLSYTSYGTFGAGKFWENQADFSTVTNDIGAIEYYNDILPANLHLSGAVVTKNKAYLIGGYNGTSVVNTIYVATVNSNGSLGAWSSYGTLPANICDMQVIVTENTCYLIGGTDGTNDLTSVYSATIDASGNLGSFTLSAVSLPVGLSAHQAFITKNTLYVVGGWNGTTSVNTVYASTINTTGGLGAFSASTTLPAAVSNHKLVYTKNRVYILGGYNGTNWLNTVYTAPISSTGLVGTWSAGTALPATLGDSMAMVFGNKVYLIGGYINGNYSDRILVSTMDASGKLGTFTIMNRTLPYNLSNGNLFITKDNVYIAGYWDGFKTVNKIIRMELDGVGLTNYSALYDGTVNKFDGVNLTGTITGGVTPTGETLFTLPNYSAMDSQDNLYSYIKA